MIKNVENNDRPSLDNGYTRISNALLEQIIFHNFKKREYKIILAIIRKTYGYNKNSDDITMTQLAQDTDLRRQHIGVTVRALVKKNVLLSKRGSFGEIISLSKNHNKWDKPQKSRDPADPKSTSEGREATRKNKNNVANDTTPVPKQDPSDPKTGSIKRIPKQDPKDPKTGSKGSQNRIFWIPKQDIQKTTPKDNSKRQLQKTIPKRALQWGSNPLPKK